MLIAGEIIGIVAVAYLAYKLFKYETTKGN